MGLEYMRDIMDRLEIGFEEAFDGLKLSLLDEATEVKSSRGLTGEDLSETISQFLFFHSSC